MTTEYSKIVTEQGVYKTSLALRDAVKEVEQGEGFINPPPYGDNSEAYINVDKVTKVVRG